MTEIRVVTHIVRRFGLVGGMETYVWNLCFELLRRGWVVNVICEKQIGTLRGVNIFQVPASDEKSRWKQMQSFRREVKNLVVSRKDLGIIHSHERSVVHHVTTFHGQPFFRPGNARKWWHHFSRRIMAWIEMEENEVASESCQAIVPVSYLVKKDILDLYPHAYGKVCDPIWPGTFYAGRDRPIKEGQAHLSFLFVGVEWRRKGLVTAINMVGLLRADFPQATLSVYGPSSDELPVGLRNIDWLHLKGFQTVIPYEDYDLLIHPAKYEAFGMVVTEARQMGLPVLMSDMVGACDVHRCHVRTLPLKSSVATWCESARDLLRDEAVENDSCRDEMWSWSNVASSYEKRIYSQVVV